MAANDWVRNKRHVLLVLAVILTGLMGCSRYPAAPELPKVSAKAAGAKAISLYDENNDGKIALEEVMKSPALRSAWRLIDKDEDRFITSEEIATHVRGWKESPSYVVDARSTFNLDGKPLEGAKVTLVAADFLGDAYPSVSAVTNSKGKANFRMDDPRYPGIYAGIYKILISKQQDGQELIPAIYNTETIFGCEYSNENWLSCFRSYRLVTEPEKNSDKRGRL